LTKIQFEILYTLKEDKHRNVVGQLFYPDKIGSHYIGFKINRNLIPYDFKREVVFEELVAIVSELKRQRLLLLFDDFDADKILR
jgi:hypothetical protein